MADGDKTDRMTELEEDNRRLRRLLDQRDAPRELRHRLNNTLAMLRVIIKRSAETRRELDDYIAHLEDRLDAVARAQASADARGMVDLHSLLADELLYYELSQGEHFSLSGPIVQLQPRAGQVLGLAFHELAVNAIEHGSLGLGSGQELLEIAWTVEAGDPDPVFTVLWKERSAAGDSRPSHRGFGTEVLTRTIRYELDATASLQFAPDGLLCTIRFPLTTRIGIAETE
jgi:two-component sensor histidine kinase